MQPNAHKLFEDIRDACAFIQEVVGGKDLANFVNDRLLCQAVERNFEIIGEAMNRLQRAFPEAARTIAEHKRIIAFRNILIHGYDVLDREIIWRVIHDNVPPLLAQAESFLADAADHG